MATSYYSALNHAAEIAPDVNKSTQFIKWAEDICGLLAHIYSREYDEVTEDLIEKVREYQDEE